LRRCDPLLTEQKKRETGLKLSLIEAL